MKKVEEIPVFINHEHVLEWIKTVDKPFHAQLKEADPKITFSFQDYYYAPAMNGYLLKLHFNYLPKMDEFGKRIYTDFYKLKKDWK